MSHCENCGTKKYGGICSNCQEELYIFTNQYEHMVKPISDEFADKILKQREEIENE